MVGMFGDIGQPQLVRGIGGEHFLHEVVVHRRPGSSGEALLLREHRPDPLLRAETGHPVHPGRDATGGKFAGDEPVPERRFVPVMFNAALIR
jgi:hypothetical protein